MTPVRSFALTAGLIGMLACSDANERDSVPGSEIASDSVTVATHPLDPLNASELDRAVSVVRSSGRLSDQARFGLIELAEPQKATVRSGSPERGAFLVAFDWATAEGFEIVVDLESEQIASWQKIDSDQPPSTYLLMMRLREIVFADSRWQAGMERLGLETGRGVAVGPGSEPDTRLPVIDGNQVVDATAYIVNRPAAPFPMAGLPFRMTVDLTEGVLVSFEDSGAELPQGADLYEPEIERPDLKPLGIHQASGPSFSIDGSRIDWQNWTLHYGVHPRRGLEIFDVSYRDGERSRSILYRASVAEMITPYGDRSWQRWYPSDEGDLNLVNYSLMEVVDGEDAPPNVTFSDAVSHDHRGNTVRYQRAAAIFERDGGILWRHWAESRRARELVLSSIFTVDNYDYALSWIFHQDGTIEAEILLSGIINFYSTERERDDDARLDDREFGHVLVAPGIAGPIHQHFFSYRLDFDVDGEANTLVEVNSATEAGGQSRRRVVPHFDDGSGERAGGPSIAESEHQPQVAGRQRERAQLARSAPGLRARARPQRRASGRTAISGRS